MNPKSTVWTVIGGASLLVGYRALKTGSDPIPQLAGVGASGVILLFLAEPLPKFASGLAVLLGVSFALNWDVSPERIRGGGVRTNPSTETVTTPGGGSAKPDQPI